MGARMTVKQWTLIDTETETYVENFRAGPSSIKHTRRDWSISLKRLRGGLSEGVDVIRVETGGIGFTVIPTRGMSLWRAHLEAHSVGWQSPIRGPVHPQFVRIGEPSGQGFLDGPAELMFRCGLESNGVPDFHDNGQLRFPLHGRIANLPAYQVVAGIDLDTERVFVRGSVEECRFLQQKLRLTVEYSAPLGGHSLTWHDRVENFGRGPAQMQMMYHTNVGHPLLKPGWQLRAPVARLCPRDAFAVSAGVDRWQTYPPPRADSWEQVYFLEMLGDEQGETQVLLHAPDEQVGVGLHYNCRQLPYFTQWRNTQAIEDGYVTGIEPGTNFPNPRSFEEQHGRIVPLPPQATWETSLRLEIHPDRRGVHRATERIADLQAQQPVEIYPQPRPAWSASA